MNSVSYSFSKEACSREPNLLKDSHKYIHSPGMRSLGSGQPTPSLFPFDKLTIESHAAPFENGIDSEIGGLNALKLEIHKDQDKSPNDIALSHSLQYGPTKGEAKLHKFVKEHTNMIHNVPYNNWDLLLTVGNTYAWDSVLRTFIDPGDSILVEEFTFSPSINAAHANGAVCIPAPMDLKGLLPEELGALLDRWLGPKPKLLYTIPTGQNPTGPTLSTERRQKIYDLCRKHNIVIVEDEPYYYLQMAPYGEATVYSSQNNDIKSTLTSSFLSLDTEGIVVRLESFSKVLAPGVRLGWIVAHEAIVDRLLLLTETSQGAPCGLIQSVVYGLLQRWGHQGYLEWLMNIRDVYSRKRNHCIDCIKEHLPDRFYEMTIPTSGMFFWIKMDARRFKCFEACNADPILVEQALWRAGIENNVLLAPGHWFKAKDNTDPPQSLIDLDSDPKRNDIFMRGTFASVSFDDMSSALKSLGDVMRMEMS